MPGVNPEKSMPAFKPIAERFSNKFVRGSLDECWPWIGATVPGGYGILGGERGSPHVYAHRFSYQHHVGPIPDGMRVLHDCDNPPCVNPGHLFLGTHEDNMVDMERKGRARVLSAKQVKRVVAMHNSGSSMRSIGEKLGVDRMTIDRAIKNAGKGDYGSDVVVSAPVGKYVRLTPAQRAKIVVLLRKDEPILRIASQFGVDRKTVRNIRDRL